MQQRMMLGDKVRSKVTGFTGIAVAHCVWLFGCDRVQVQPPVDKDGKDRSPVWMDTDELEVVEYQKMEGSWEHMVRGGVYHPSEDTPDPGGPPLRPRATGGGASPSSRKHEP